jgi:2'-5' RNA ligase
MDRTKEQQKPKLLRLFVALLLPEEAKQELGALMTRLKPLATGVKWVEPKNLHLTLKFLGDTPEEKLAGITAAIGDAVQGNAKLSLVLSGCGAFPNLHRPRVIWAGCEGIDVAAEMAKEIDRRMRKFGFKKEKRRFAAHLTVGLVKSTLTPTGPIYEHCQLYELV